MSSCGAARPGWVPRPAVRPELAANLPDGNAACSARRPPSRRCWSAAGRGKAGGRSSDRERSAMAGAARRSFDLATAAWREAKPVTLALDHQRSRYCEPDACWPT
jgi:hypothetical protein